MDPQIASLCNVSMGAERLFDKVNIITLATLLPSPIIISLGELQQVESDQFGIRYPD